MKTTVQLYYMESCDYSMRFKSEWEKLKKLVENNPDIITEEFESEKDSKKMQEEKIFGYPTIIIITDSGEKTEYNGERSAEAILKYINKEVAQDDNKFKQCSCSIL